MNYVDVCALFLVMFSGLVASPEEGSSLLLKRLILSIFMAMEKVLLNAAAITQANLLFYCGQGQFWILVSSSIICELLNLIWDNA
jgi:hypothetical protein